MKDRLNKTILIFFWLTGNGVKGKKTNSRRFWSWVEVSGDRVQRNVLRQRSDLVYYGFFGKLGQCGWTRVFRVFQGVEEVRSMDFGDMIYTLLLAVENPRCGHWSNYVMLAFIKEYIFNESLDGESMTIMIREDVVPFRSSQQLTGLGPYESISILHYALQLESSTSHLMWLPEVQRCLDLV